MIYGRNLQGRPAADGRHLWYLVLTTVLTVVQYYVERHYARGALRTLPPTPLQRLRWTVLAAAHARGPCRERRPDVAPPRPCCAGPPLGRGTA